jgi:hypothetical protein
MDWIGRLLSKPLPAAAILSKISMLACRRWRQASPTNPKTRKIQCLIKVDLAPQGEILNRALAYQARFSPAQTGARNTLTKRFFTGICFHAYFGLGCRR